MCASAGASPQVRKETNMALNNYIQTQHRQPTTFLPSLTSAARLRPSPRTLCQSLSVRLPAKKAAPGMSDSAKTSSNGRAVK